MEVPLQSEEATEDRALGSSSKSIPNKSSLPLPALHALHQHLVESLLGAKCADVRLCAFDRIYSVHRSMLIQASFFHDLLNGEFQEARLGLGVWRNKNEIIEDDGELRQQDAIELHFDDQNITRPAFEFCLGFLYGAAPRLVLPSWASPSLAHPLTEHFEHEHNRSTESGNYQPSSSILDHQTSDEAAKHPATPRFLLSLLATATYLGIPSVTSQAMTLIICSITPYTVSHYLSFALGYGIFGASEVGERRVDQDCDFWDWELEGPAWGLSSISQVWTGSSSKPQSISERTRRLRLNGDGPESSDDESASSDQDTKRSSATGQIPAPRTTSTPIESTTSFLGVDDEEQIFYYGAQSDRIGEACSCWLLRWGADVLLAEEQIQQGPYLQRIDNSLLFGLLPRGQLPVNSTLSSDDYPRSVQHLLRPPFPAVWCHPQLRGVPARVVREIVSNDSLWIRSEWDRYEIARRIVAMRRSYVDLLNAESDEEKGNNSDSKASSPHIFSGIVSSCGSSSTTLDAISLQQARNARANFADRDDSDEKEYAQLFSEGIYYMHMSFSELSAISNHICPSMGCSYTPIHVLQKALWSQSELKNLILSTESQRKEEPAVDASMNADGLQTLELLQSQDTSQTRQPEKESSTNDLSLGLSNPEKDYAKAYKGLSKRGRSSRAHLDDHGHPLKLGGLKPTMHTGGVSNALEGLLSNAFYAVSTDDTVRIGESLSGLTHSSQENPVSSSIPQQLGAPSGIASAMDGTTLPLTREPKRSWQQGFFGLRNVVKTGKELGKESTHEEKTPNDASQDILSPREADGRHWTGFEPMRMGLEFFGVNQLSEKQRMYSPSFFYAGSVWNLYVQTVKKPKGLQLGIYLHRQNWNDALPNPSLPRTFPMENSYTYATAVDTAINTGNTSLDSRSVLSSGDISRTSLQQEELPSHATLTGNVFYSGNSLLNDANSPTTSQQRSPNRAVATHANPLASSPSSHLYGSNIQAIYSNSAPSIQGSRHEARNGLQSSASLPSGSHPLAIPYLDERRVLHAYFSIHCPSPTGTCLTKFSSQPDNFTLSQSWGWKSSSLLGHVHLEDGQLGSSKSQIAETFRCVVTLGVV